MRTSNLSVLKRLDSLVALARARAAGAAAAFANQGVIVNGTAPGDLTAGTNAGIVIAAFDLTPKTAAGLFQGNWLLNFTLSAADTVRLDVEVAELTGNITGGLSSGAAHWETGQGAGQPLVIPITGVFTNELTAIEQFAAGQIASCSMNLAGLVGGITGQARSVIALKATVAGGAHLTGMSLAASAYELGG